MALKTPSETDAMLGLDKIAKRCRPGRRNPASAAANCRLSQRFPRLPGFGLQPVFADWFPAACSKRRRGDLRSAPFPRESIGADRVFQEAMST
ncbi:MAG TPA: hypothetical protein VFQ80_00060 [Thermomicrobiales bacterium]|nr:hypothetical protein [Thermomicrobiales bacterium]